MKRQPIRSRSKRMAKLMRYYVKEVRPSVLCGRIGWECHHTHGKVRTLLIDTRFISPVTRELHNWIRDNPIAARESGLLCPKGQWNHAPNDAETQRLKDLIIEITKGQ